MGRNGQDDSSCLVTGSRAVRRQVYNTRSVRLARGASKADWKAQNTFVLIAVQDNGVQTRQAKRGVTIRESSGERHKEHGGGRHLRSETMQSKTVHIKNQWISDEVVFQGERLKTGSTKTVAIDGSLEGFLGKTSRCL